MTRYYGEGYERGDLLTICAVAEWCEMNIPNCVVWYGGDSSGVLAEPFDAARRHELKRHLYSKQGREYFESGFLQEESFQTPSPCGLCIPGEPRFNRCGWGGSGDTEYIGVDCAGCGKRFDSRDAGRTWVIVKDDA